MVTSMKALNKTVEASQLTSDLGGTFTYSHSDWMQFHQVLNVPWMCLQNCSSCSITSRGHFDKLWSVFRLLYNHSSSTVGDLLYSNTKHSSSLLLFKATCSVSFCVHGGYCTRAESYLNDLNMYYSVNQRQLREGRLWKLVMQQWSAQTVMENVVSRRKMIQETHMS